MTRAAVLAEVFERAPGLAERVASALGADADADMVVAAAREVLGGMSEAERIAVLDAHPRIGADHATLSPRSRHEQRGAADARTLADLARLNDDYERRFGFRFVVRVNGRTKAEIVPVLRERLRNARDRELATGVEEFLAIARDRLRAVR